MTWQTFATMVSLGLGAGVVGGLFGIGGGLVIVPALILIVGFDQKTATGTSLLAQLLPVAILAVLEFGRQGKVDIPRGLSIAAGLLFGTLVGALLNGVIPGPPMKRIYGGFLVIIGAYFLMGSPVAPRPAPIITAPPSPPE